MATEERLARAFVCTLDVNRFGEWQAELVNAENEGKPDVYDLKDSNGTYLGRASVQTLSISQALQQKRSTGESIKVLAEWNEDFESYVVTSVF